VPDVDVPITAGTGTNIRAFQKVSGDYDQYVREAGATAKGTLSNIPWLVTTAGLPAVIAAETRVGLVIVSAATGTVYLRFDTTIPTPSATPPLYDWYLQPGDRYEVPLAFDAVAISMVGSTAGGYILAAAGVCA
jgi:hypothetical protein